MKNYSIIILIIFSLSANQSSAQQIIQLVEKDMDGGSFENRRNADINSQLILKISKDSLLKKLRNSSDSASLPTDIDTLLEVLNAAIVKKQEWMQRTTDALTSFEAGNKTAVTNFVENMGDVAGDIVGLLESDQKLLTYFFEEDTTNLWAQLTIALTRRVKEVEQELFNSPKYSDVRIQVGGWLIHNNEKSPLHFEGLDTNPLGEFYEVERWRFTPTKEQLEELERLQELAKSDELREANLVDIIKSKYVSAVINELKNRLSIRLEEFKNKSEGIVGSLPIGPVKTDIQQLISSTKTFLDFVRTKLDFYINIKNNPTSVPQLLANITGDVKFFDSTQKAIRSLLGTLKTDIAAATSAIRTAVADISSIIPGLLVGLANDLLDHKILDILSSRPINDLALEFTEKVIPLSLQDLPEESPTDLRYAGFREPGDRVVVKLVVTKGGLDNRLFQETRDITLYRILSHIETTVGVIFAHPLSESSIKKDFQMAPYYNALFKGIFGASKKWKRNSGLPNTILDMSFGLHVSTPDFDKDDVPELGFGIVMSTLKDFLQVGVAYNIFHGTPYVFFGAKLPIGNINLGSNRGSAPSVPD